MDTLDQDSVHVEAASRAFAQALQVWTLESAPLKHLLAQEGYGVTLGAAAFIDFNVPDLQTAKHVLREAYTQVQIHGYSEHEPRFQSRIDAVQLMLVMALKRQEDDAKARRDLLNWPAPRE